MGKQSKGYEREKIELADMEVEFKRLQKYHKKLMKKLGLDNLMGLERQVILEHIELIKKMNEIRYNINYDE